MLHVAASGSMNTLNSPTMPTTDKAAATPNSSNIFFLPSKLRPGIRNLPDPGPDLWRKRGKEWEGRNEEEEGGDLCKCCHRSSPPPPPPVSRSPLHRPKPSARRHYHDPPPPPFDGRRQQQEAVKSSPRLFFFWAGPSVASHPSIHRRRKGKNVRGLLHPPTRAVTTRSVLAIF